MPLKWKVSQVVDLVEGFLDVTLPERSLASKRTPLGCLRAKTSCSPPRVGCLRGHARPRQQQLPMRAVMACNPSDIVDIISRHRISNAAGHRICLLRCPPILQSTQPSLPYPASRSAPRTRRTTTSGIIYGHIRTPRLRRQEQSLGPPPFLGTAADDPRQRRHQAHQSAAHGAQGRARHGVRHHERRAAQALRREPRVRFLFRHPQPGALPGQRVRAEPRRRSGDADDSFQGAEPGGAEVPGHLQGNLGNARAASCW